MKKKEQIERKIKLVYRLFNKDHKIGPDSEFIRGKLYGQLQILRWVKRGRE